MRRTTAFAVTAILLGACAPTTGQGPQREGPDNARPCLSTDRITNFRTGNDGELYIKTFGDDVFQLQTSACFDIDSAISIAVTPDFGGSNRLCVGDSARIFLPNSTVGPNPCRVRLERRLAEAEVEALPARSRP